MPQKVCGAATQDSANERNKSNSAISGMSNVHHLIQNTSHYAYVRTYVYTYVRTYLHTYIHTYLYVYYIYMCVYVKICVYKCSYP